MSVLSELAAPKYQEVDLRAGCRILLSDARPVEPLDLADTPIQYKARMDVLSCASARRSFSAVECVDCSSGASKKAKDWRDVVVALERVPAA